MSIYAYPVPQILDGKGVPIIGAKLFFFEPGTTTKKDTFSDSDLLIENTNPLISDADGRYGPIFLNGIYKNVQQDNTGTPTGFDGATIWTRDPIGDIDITQLGLYQNESTYNIPDIVTDSNDDFYRSLTDSNQGNEPSTNPTNWEQVDLERFYNATVTYAAGDEVIGSNGARYIATRTTSNLDPVNSDTTKWKSVVNNKNHIINGDFFVTQRTISAQNDGDYLFDRWIGLSDGNSVFTIGTFLNNGAFGSSSHGQMTVATIGKKFGLVQLIEAKNSADLIGNIATLSITAESSNINNLRVAIIGWSGTKDSPTKDVVASWNAQGTNPTLATDWAYQNTPVNIALTGAFLSTYNAENISIGASLEQLAVFFWVDDTIASISDTVRFSKIKLETGPFTTDFENADIDQQFSACERYYEVGRLTFSGDVTNTGDYQERVSYRATKRISPAVVLTNTGSSTNFPSTVGTTGGTETDFRELRTANATGAAGIFSSTWTSDAELGV